MIQKIFTDIFNAEPIVVRSPVPIRLLGEWNEYNDGWLLTVTINKWVSIAVSKRGDPGIQLFSVQHMEKIELLPTDMIGFTKTSWAKPVFAAIYQFYIAGHHLQGMNIVIDTTQIEDGIPCTAALDSGLYVALNELFNLQLSPETIMKIARTSFDPDFYSCLFGQKDYALKLDTRNSTHDFIPLRLSDHSLVLFVMGNRPAVAADIHRNRLCACEDALFQLKKTYPAIQSIRDVPLPLLYIHVRNAETRRRAAFITRENTRVIAAATNLQTGNLKAFGQKLTESDAGLLTEYETGSIEANWLIDEMEWSEQIAGARRLTGPFRNAAIALIRASKLEEITNNVTGAYEKEMGKKLMMQPLSIVNGTEVLKYTEHSSSFF